MLVFTWPPLGLPSDTFSRRRYSALDVKRRGTMSKFLREAYTGVTGGQGSLSRTTPISIRSLLFGQRGLREVNGMASAGLDSASFFLPHPWAPVPSCPGVVMMRDGTIGSPCWHQCHKEPVPVGPTGPGRNLLAGLAVMVVSSGPPRHVAGSGCLGPVCIGVEMTNLHLPDGSSGGLRAFLLTVLPSLSVPVFSLPRFPHLRGRERSDLADCVGARVCNHSIDHLMSPSQTDRMLWGKGCCCWYKTCIQPLSAGAQLSPDITHLIICPGDTLDTRSLAHSRC